MARTTEPMDEENTGSTGSKEMSALAALWSLFSSMRTAIVLLLLLAAVSMFISFFKRDTEAMAAYQSPLYVLLLGLVGLNLAVCSVNRFRQAWRRTFSPNLRIDPDQLQKGEAALSVIGQDTTEVAADKVEKVLRARSYAVTREQHDDQAVVFYATRGRLAIWGPYLTHLSILCIFIGALFGNRTGFDGFMTVTEGRTKDHFTLQQRKNEEKPKEKTLRFALGLRNFQITYDKDHNPTGYLSDLQVLDGGKVVKQQVIDVNHPLTYKGVTFYQASYGLVGMVVKITAPNGEMKYVPFSIKTEADEHGDPMYMVDGQPYQTVPFGEKKLTVFVHHILPDFNGKESISSLPINPAVNLMVNERFPEYRGMDAWTKLDWLEVSHSAKYQGYTVTIERVVKYTGLSVARNPGLPVVYLGFGLLVLGIFISFYITHRILRVHIATSGQRVRVIAGGTARGDAGIFAKDLERLRNEISA